MMKRSLALPLLAALAALAVSGPAASAAPAAAAPSTATAPLVSLPQVLRAAATAGETVTLRRAVSVIDDTVRLGDLFTGPVPRPDRVVARAPAPGERLTLDARWLAATAKAAGVAWQPLSASDSVVVDRQGRYVDSTEILAALTDALAARGMEGTVELDLSGGLQPVVVAADSTALVTVVDATFDARSGRFSAILGLPVEGREKTLRVSGRAHRTVEVPVLTRNLRRDEVIGADDVDWRSMRVAALSAGVVTEPGGLVGQAAQRALRAGEPVRARDLAEPSLVEKGQMVTMVLETPLMTLTAKGRALEDGPLGASVRIQNLRSNKTILGRVTADRQVSIDTSQTAALN
jgi:flagella basal body P-ring formation protein FlgA